MSGTPQGAQAHVAVLTRPAGQSAALAARLQALGWQVHDWPALALTGLPPEAVPRPEAFELVVFVSGNAARFYLGQLQALSGAAPAHPLVWPREVRVGAVGPSSAAAARRLLGDEVEIVAPPLDAPAFDSEALWARLLALPRLPRSVLIVRGGDGREGHGRPWLAAQFAAQGVPVTLHAAYRRSPAVWPACRLLQLCSWQVAGVFPVWHVSSREGLSAIIEQLGVQRAVDAWVGGRVVVGHPRIADALAQLIHSCGRATRMLQGPGAVSEPGCVVIQTTLPHDDAVLATIVN